MWEMRVRVPSAVPTFGVYMIPITLSDETRAIGKPRDWDEKRDGLCSILSVHDRLERGRNIMISGWKPDPIELEALNNGGTVMLGIMGKIHPVVQLYVAE